MKVIKITKVQRKKKPKVGYNTLYLVMCEHCGEIQLVWDTNMYNRTCPLCKDTGEIMSRDKVEIKDNIFDLSIRLYNEYKTNNTLSTAEMGRLSSFRETESLSELKELVQLWFRPRTEYTVLRTKQHCINKRGRALLKNPDFMEMLKECYLLAHSNMVLNK